MNCSYNANLRLEGSKRALHHVIRLIDYGVQRTRKFKRQRMSQKAVYCVRSLSCFTQGTTGVRQATGAGWLLSGAQAGNMGGLPERARQPGEPWRRELLVHITKQPSPRKTGSSALLSAMVGKQSLGPSAIMRLPWHRSPSSRRIGRGQKGEGGLVGDR
jgi:hypothetical protein